MKKNLFLKMTKAKNPLLHLWLKTYKLMHQQFNALQVV